MCSECSSSFLSLPHSMATDSIFGQLRLQQQHPTLITSIPSTSSFLVESLPSGPDPLQGLVQEMALSAVIQKHSSSTSSSSSSSSLVQPSVQSVHTNGTIIKSYYMQTPAGGMTAAASLPNNIVALPEPSSSSAPLVSFPSSSSPSSSSSGMIGITSFPGGAGQLHPQGPSVLLGPPAGSPGGVQTPPHGYITLPTPSSSSSVPLTSAGPSIPVLARHQPGGPTVLQAQTAALKLPQISGQFQEVIGSGTGNMVQLTPVCYGGPQARGIQAPSATAMGTVPNFVG